VENLLPDERRALHATFAEAVGQSRSMSVDDVVTLADHFWHAGNLEAAYRWALRGASIAETSGGSAEALRLLRRALDIWPRIHEPDETGVSLLHRLRQSAHASGRQTDELAAVEELLTLLDREREPLAVVPLLIARTQLRRATGIDAAGTLDGFRDAARLSSRYPDSVEHALATAYLARSMLMHADDPAGMPLASTALRLAEQTGSELAVGHALTAVALAEAVHGKLDAALRTFAQAREIGVRLREFELVVWTAYVAAPALEDNDEGVEMFHQVHQQLATIGAPHPYIAEMCAWEAEYLLWTGDWRRCQAKLRVALGGRPSLIGDVRGRLTAATLACRQGRQSEAEAHLARANEIFADHDSWRNMDFHVVRVEVAATSGDSDRAVELAVEGLAEDPKPLYAERLLPLAARALADRAAACRDRGEDASATTARITALRAAYPTVADIAVEARSAWDQRFNDAMQAVTDAETARGLDRPNQAASWRRAATACHAAADLWSAAYSRWREAEAALRDRATRSDGITALREAHRVATDLQAVPILTQLEALARSARIPLAAPAPEAAGDAATVPGLTGREREILAHLAAGRTYAEIAKALVLSEKTVSVHVSNMLRKTGTTNRVELTQLAHRLEEGIR
jgi:DNA-binding CsgD family transcriptional regulator